MPPQTVFFPNTDAKTQRFPILGTLWNRLCIGGRGVSSWEGGQTDFGRGGVVFYPQGGNKLHLSEGGKGGGVIKKFKKFKGHRRRPNFCILKP